MQGISESSGNQSSDMSLSVWRVAAGSEISFGILLSKYTTISHHSYIIYHSNPPANTLYTGEPPVRIEMWRRYSGVFTTAYNSCTHFGYFFVNSKITQNVLRKSPRFSHPPPQHHPPFTHRFVCATRMNVVCTQKSGMFSHSAEIYKNPEATMPHEGSK